MGVIHQHFVFFCFCVCDDALNLGDALKMTIAQTNLKPGSDMYPKGRMHISRIVTCISRSRMHISRICQHIKYLNLRYATSSLATSRCMSDPDLDGFVLVLNHFLL